MRKVFLVISFGLLLWLPLLSGCAEAPTRSPAPPTSVPPISVSEVPRPTAPVVVLIEADQSGSTNWTRTPQISVDDLKPLEDVLVKYGGEIAFGLIRDESNRGFIRLRVSVPPAAPPRPNLDGIVNEIDKADAIDAYDRLREEWEAAMSQRRADVERRFADFLNTIKPLLEEPAKGNTDVWGAIRRADVLLSEDAAAWPREPHRYLFLASDGEDTVGKKPVAFNSGAKIVLVNGEGRTGSLAQLGSVTCFESVRSGIDFIVAQEEKNNGNR